MVEDYKYLDEERVKLWAELRETQEKLQSLMDIASQTEDGGQRALISIGTKAARAYHRLLAREKEISDFVERGEATWSRVVSCEKEAIAKSANVRQAAEAVDSAHKLIDQHLSAAELRLNEASARAKSAEARLDAIEESLARSSEAASAYDKLNAEFKSKQDRAFENYQEIAKWHSLLFGYTKDDGTVVEGKLRHLEDVYGELETKITQTKTDAEKFEKEYAERATEVLNKAKEDHAAIVEKLRTLMPDALTAGLSSAYQQNRQAEEVEQGRLLGSFNRAIWSLVILALLPVAVNLYMLFVKDYTMAAIIQNLPREMLCVMPLYVPVFWLAVFANKRVNLSKRLIEEYKHKESVSKTYEGLARQIESIEDEKTSKELQARLLYNTVLLSEKNPGELIKNFNRPDNPLLDVLNQSTKFAGALEKLSRVPGFDRVFHLAEKSEGKRKALEDSVEMVAVAKDE